MAPRTVMDHVESLFIHVKKVEIKVEVMDIVSQIGVQCDTTIQK